MHRAVLCGDGTCRIREALGKVLGPRCCVRCRTAAVLEDRLQPRVLLPGVPHSVCSPFRVLPCLCHACEIPSLTSVGFTSSFSGLRVISGHKQKVLPLGSFPWPVSLRGPALPPVCTSRELPMPQCSACTEKCLTLNFP